MTFRRRDWSIGSMTAAYVAVTSRNKMAAAASTTPTTIPNALPASVIAKVGRPIWRNDRTPVDAAPSTETADELLGSGLTLCGCPLTERRFNAIERQWFRLSPADAPRPTGKWGSWRSRRVRFLSTRPGDPRDGAWRPHLAGSAKLQCGRITGISEPRPTLKENRIQRVLRGRRSRQLFSRGVFAQLRPNSAGRSRLETRTHLVPSTGSQANQFW